MSRYDRLNTARTVCRTGVYFTIGGYHEEIVRSCRGARALRARRSRFGQRPDLLVFGCRRELPGAGEDQSAAGLPGFGDQQMQRSRAGLQECLQRRQERIRQHRRRYAASFSLVQIARMQG